MQKSYQKELLDAEDIPQKHLWQNLRELDFINRNLGGHSVVKAGFKYFPTKNNTVLEIGSGGGDNLRMLQRNFPENKYVGVDLKSDCINFSINHSKNIDFVQSDYRLYTSKTPTDIIFNSLFCHHFDDEALVEMLKWMKNNAQKGFFIADLHRHWLAYFSIKWLTALFSKSYLVKNDAPLSVKRGFTQKEWSKLLEMAGIVNCKIYWKWAFRYLIVVKNA